MPYLKHIPHEEPLVLVEQVSVLEGQIVSKTLAQNRHVTLTLFAFSKGEEISTHASTGDAMVQVLEGEALLTVDGKEHRCKAGETLIMPANKPHAVFAPEDMKMLLTVVFPTQKQG